MTQDLPPVDPGMLSFYEALLAESPPEAVHWPLERQRKSWESVCAKYRAPRPAGLLVEDMRIAREGGGQVPVRLYRPPGSGLLPGIIYFHGGGWVLGSLETHDDMCAEMADGARACVIAVDYRLAPEHPHPAQLEDALAVTRWIRSQGGLHGIDPGRLIAAGDSAGGQMSASLALWLRDHAERPLDGMVLIYPVLGTDTQTPSYLRNADAPCLTRADMIYYLESLLGPQGSLPWRDPYAAPLTADDFSNLPPAFITAAAHDPLCDDAVMFARRLRDAGGEAALRIERDLAHSYMRARHVSAPAARGFAAIVSALASLAHHARLPEENGEEQK